MDAHRVALGDVGIVVEHDAVAIAVHVAAPVAVAVPVVVPAMLVLVVVHVPGIVRLDLADAEILEVPAQGLAHREPVPGAVVGIGGASEGGAVWLALVYDVIDVSGEDVAAPARRVARHEPEAVVGVQRIVPVRHPQHGNVPQADPGVPDRGRMLLAVRELAGQAPVEAAVIVRAGGHQRIAA